MADRYDKTRSYNCNTARMAKERQRRQYEQQRKEKFIFAAFVVIIILMILFAIIVFKKALGSEQDHGQNDQPTTPITDQNPPTPTESYTEYNYAESAIYSGSLISVNTQNKYQKVYNTDVRLENVAASRTTLENKKYTYYLENRAASELEANTLAALNKMADDFFELYGNDELDVSAAHSDSDLSSDHATGYSFDLLAWYKSSAGKDVKCPLNESPKYNELKWVINNCYKYGFIVESPTESGETYHHFRYVGIPHAYYMHQNGLSLEDYLTLLKTKHTFSQDEDFRLCIETDSGAQYEVYYCPSSGSMTSVPILDGVEGHAVSGDNEGGFVVTLTLN